MNNPLFEILICTLEDRREMLRKLKDELCCQIAQLDEPGAVVISESCDSGEATTGAKREELLLGAKGEFVAFIDDDDWVASNYVSSIVSVIQRNPGSLDVVGFFGRVEFSCGTIRNMMHSLMCPIWTEDMSTYYRPPNHLNPIRTELAKQVRFKDITISEDHHWSIEMANKRILKREVFLGGPPLYVYQCREPLKGL
jgi:hypothetical protein